MFSEYPLFPLRKSYYLESLPVDQRGEAWIDRVNDRIVVQVTRDAGRVITELRSRVDKPDEVAVETIRWSRKDLAAFERRISEIDDLDLSDTGYGNADGRVEVEMPGDADKARRKIAETINPCAFVVTGYSKPSQPS